MSISLVIKPILRCNANCYHCDSRLNLHRSKKDNGTLTSEEWLDIFKKAKKLGVDSLHISGGEPFLSKEIYDIIEKGKQLKFKININTNGSLLNNYNRIKKIASLGVDSITISFLSHIPLIHNNIKGIRNLHEKSTQALEYAKQCGISTYAQTILLNTNILSFNEFLDWVINILKTDALFISYVEGPYSNAHPSLNNIELFRNNVLPNALNLVKKSFNDEQALIITESLQTLFAGSSFSLNNVAKGIYNCDLNFSCKVPSKQILILANGDVHPCNAIEYFYEPVAGNIKNDDLKNIWNNSIYKKMRAQRFQICKQCPVPHHICLNFNSKQLIRGATGRQ